MTSSTISSAGRMQTVARDLIQAASDVSDNPMLLDRNWLNSLEELGSRYFIAAHGEWDVSNASFKCIPTERCLELAGIETTNNRMIGILKFLNYIARGGFHPSPEKPVIPYECDGGASLEAAPDRPEHTDEIKLSAAIKTVDEIPNIDDECEKESLAELIVREAGIYDSGFEVAKDIEMSTNINFDTMTIEALDCYQSHVDDELKKAGKEWVKQHGIKPQFELGARIKFFHGEGVVIGVDERGPAQYKVRKDDHDENTYTVVEFEKATLVDS